LNVTGETVRAWEILSNKLTAWLSGAIAVFPNLIVASFVMLAFWLAARVLSNLAERVLRHTSDSNAVTNLIVTSTRVLVLFFGLFTTLGILNLDKTVASLLAGAGVIGLAVGFAFQEIAANFFSGILIAFRKPYRDGDIVQIDEFIGVVSELTLRTTNIRTFSGLEVLVPNKDMFTKPVTNFTKTPDRRVDLDIGVSYGDDLRKVEQVAREAVEKIEGRLPGRPTEFFYRQFGDSSINFQLRFWIGFRHQTDYLMAVHRAIIAIKDAFDQNKITIPFPIRTLEFADSKLEFSREKK
jgi:small conductance mechanosensitive channel